MQEPILKIRLFGEITLSYGDRVCTSNSSRSKKIWMLIAYLIANRNHTVTQNDLIDILWEGDDSSNPANTLKTLLHRARAVLDDLGLPEGINLIRNTGGTCSWNNDIPCRVDAEEFDSLLNEISQHPLSDEELCDKFSDALDLYRGIYLPGFESESWALPLVTYFRSRFMQATASVIELMDRLGRYEELCDRCRHAIAQDPYEENLHIALITGLLAMDRGREALEHYRYVSDLYLSAFGINPSPELKAVYQKIAQKINAPENDISVILSTLDESDRPSGCFYCEYEIFKSVYRLEARNAARNGNTMYVCLLSLSSFGGGELPQRTLNRAMHQLSETIRTSLRSGDIYTRYSVSQYLVMLPNVSAENGTKVLDRIAAAFRRENPKSPAFLRTSLQPMSLPQF